MKTNQVLESISRDLEGRIIKQRTKDEFLCLDDILAIGNLYRLNKGLKAVNFSCYIGSEKTQEFILELEKELGKTPYIRGAKNKSGWVHPFLGIKILTWFNPSFEVKVYKWLFDYLIEHRIKGANSYQTMCGVLFNYCSNKAIFSNDIQNLAIMIKQIIKVEDWNKASNEQLAERDLLHNYITDLTRTLKDADRGIRLGIEMYKSRKDNK